MGQCFECGSPSDHNHHVVPKSKGGTRTVPLCERCHGLVHGVDFTSHRELTRAALAAKRARGERLGKVPYGFTVAADRKTLLPEPREQAVIARIRAWRADGKSYRQIARWLERDGAPKRGEKWNVSVIHALAKREAA